MRISFDWELNFPDLKQIYLDNLCRFKGHVWKKYRKPTGLPIEAFYYDFFIGRKPIRVCERCGQFQYKTIKKTIGKTVRFTRYSPMKKDDRP